MDIFGNFSNLKGDKRKRIVRDEEELDYSFTDGNTLGKIESREYSFPGNLVKFFLVLIFCGLISRLFFLQIVKGEINQKLAEGNKIRPRIIEAYRGVITDNNGVWLAQNTPNFGLALYPSDLPKKKDEREEVYKKLSDITGMGEEEIKSQSEENGLFSLDMVLLQENIPHDDALILEKKVANLQGVFVAKKSSRKYETIPGMSHLLGYMGKIAKEDLEKDESEYLISDRIGKTGLEFQYENELKGKHGVEQIEVDSKGNIIRVLVQDGRREPAPGNNISLHLDRGLQELTGTALKNGLEESKKQTGRDDVVSGVAMVMDVKTGGILAMVSLPDYDNNLFSKKISSEDYKRLLDDKSYPMFNRATKGTYPPGSIVKIVMAAAGLSEGVINQNTAFDTPSEIRIGEFSFPDWKDHGHTNIERAIAESNNIFFYSIGGGFDKIRGIGIENINKYWKAFGLGEKTGIDLPGEVAGLLPTPEWKKKTKKEPWYIGDTYHVSIGQGDLLVTPLQMLRATAAIANGGKLLNPQLVKKITDHDGNVIKEFDTRVENEQIVGSEIINTIQRGMRMTVTEGSARNLSDLPVSVAGKTGTAQFFNNEKTHAWFECYAPYEDPQIAVITMVEGGGGGHEIAAPIAKEILNYYFTR